jgi:regulator of sigma E protease
VIQTIVGAVSIALMFLLLVAPHEGGHFAFAKLFGVEVKEFSVGMGNRLWSRVHGGTLYALRLFPIGGYVRLTGMEPGDDFNDPNGFHRKPAWQRILVLLGGPLVNFVMAALIMTGVFLTQLNSDPGLIAAVYTNTPAAAAGLRPGDSVVAVGGRQIQRPEDIRSAEQAAGGAVMEFTIRHADGRTSTVTMQPQYDAQRKAYLIGVENVPILGPVDAVQAGVTFPYVAGKGLLSGIAMLVTGQIPGGVFGPQGATGAIGIAAITYSAAVAGLLQWLTVAAALSVALGLANLLPLPALDGGRIVVVLIERLRGRPFDREREMTVQRYGLAALLVLVAFIAYFDIQRLVNHQFPGLK